MRAITLGVFILMTGILFADISEAVNTKVIVRAKSKDAKFIGTSMGGVLVIIRDSETEEILSKGFITGETGDTKKIMLEPHKRGAVLSDETAAKFETTIDIDEPKLFTVEVYAPYAQGQSKIKSTTQVWLIPGKDIVGDGIIVEIPGFAVDALTPQPHETFKLKEGKVAIPIKANVVMMCGCPVEPGGIWDANKYAVKAIVKHNGEVIDTLPLSYANKTSTFEGKLDVTKEGVYELIVYSYDPDTGNTGVDKTTFKISR